MKANSSLTSRIAICLVMSLAATAASARTVYDAGKAFVDAGHNTNTFGAWSLLNAADDSLASTAAFDSTTGGTSPLVGIGGSTSPWIRVNSGSASEMSDGEEILPGELYLHPGNPTSDKPFDVVRFTAPDDGYYSAVVFVHDCAKGTTFGQYNPQACAGVQVTIRACGNILARQIVSLEDQASDNPTRRFDFQMPVRWMSKGETIEVVVGNKSATSSGHSNDATGLRFSVTKEDEGAFYDSGVAMTNNLATSYANPYGTIKDGTWYYLLAAVPAGTDFSVWAPANFNNALTSRISTNATRSDANSQRGFAGEANGSSPYVLVNETSSASPASVNSSSQASAIAPCELHVHPKASDLNAWPTIRFRPPESGYYSASVVARDVIRGKSTDTPTPDGVDVYMLVSGHVVTSAYISAETFASTARMTFDARLLVAGEPVDIAVYAHGTASSDATGISAIFRRESGDVYDAGKAYYEEHASNRCSNYFVDSLGGNAKWLLSSSTNQWNPADIPLPTYLVTGGWWVHATDSNNNGTAPRFAMVSSGKAFAGSPYLNSGAPLLSAAACDLIVSPQEPTSAAGYATLRAEVPANGIYRVRGYFRDLNNSATVGDGIRAIISANSYVSSCGIVSRDAGNSTCPFESVLSADRLWLKQGDFLHYTVDPIGNATSDVTAVTACYEIEEASPSAHVVNIDVTGTSGSGRYSSITSTAREGWSDWNRWNAIRFSSSLPQTSSRTIENCREADGTTKGNVSFTITRDSGAAILKGYGNGPTGLHNIWVASEGSGDTYTLRLSKLKKNEPYTLWLYSAKATAAGNATFTVGGVTKGVEEPWSLGATNMVTRFEATSDAGGRITGTFAAASDEGGAFNGLTLVGEFPEYIEPGMFIIVR